jgi:hypothetical protein
MRAERSAAGRAQARPSTVLYGIRFRHRVLAGEQAHQAVDLVGAVVDAVEQRPLHLHRIAGGARVGVAARDQLVGRDGGRVRQQAAPQRSVAAVQRQRQRRLDAAERQALEDAAIAHRRQHQLLVADAAAGAEEVDRLEHGIEVVRRLAHAHEDHLGHRAQAARERDLGDDLGAAELALEAAQAGHAEHAATAQPTWLDTHRPPRGSSTASTERPSARPTRRRREPSALAWSARSTASARSSASSAGSSVRSESGRKSSGRCRPFACGSARDHWRSTRSSWTGRAPAARRRWRRAPMCMDETAPAAVARVARAGGLRRRRG